MAQHDKLTRSIPVARPGRVSGTHPVAGDAGASGGDAPSDSLEFRLDAATPESPVALGSYLVIRRVGAGAMGVVYEARDRRGQRVALKTIRGKKPQWLHYLKNEFRSVADVTAPNLAALYELVAEGGDWYFTMEFIEGVEFLDHVTAAGSSEADTINPSLETAPRAATAAEVQGAPSPLRQADMGRLRSCMQQLALGVHALHEAGKLHRDLKPSNVLVEASGRVLVVDFGLVHDGRSEHDAGKIQGTPAYMAPEQARGEPAQPASDWYAVGVMLYQALAGSLPFGGSVQQVLFAKQWEPPPPSSLSPGVPADLDALCADLLHLDPAARPPGTEVLRRLGVDAPPRPRRSGGRHLLVGRQAEIASLFEAYADTAPGRPVVQWVHGGSGMGKSALLDGFLAELRRTGGPLVLRGRCHACESVPYKAFDAVLDELARYLCRLASEHCSALLPAAAADLATVFPVLRGAIEHAGKPEHAAGGDMDRRERKEARAHVFRTLKEMLRRVAAQRPLVIAIDDLQWGDIDSAHLVRELLAPPDAPELLFIGLYRSNEASHSPFLRELTELWPGDVRGGARELALELLPAEEAARLARELLGPGTDAVAETIAAEARGSPFLIEELVRYARHGASGRASPSSEGPSVERLVLARIEDLPPRARRLLEIVAVAGRSVEQRVALAAAGLGAEAMPVVRALETGSLLRPDGLRDEDAVEVYHDRIRESVIGSLAPEVLAGCHRALGQALESRGTAEPEVLAHHFLLAGDRDRGVLYALRAAERASAALAFDRAAELYRVALDSHSGPGPARRELKLRLADALVNAGRCAEAAPCYLACSHGAPSAEAMDLRRRAAEQLLVAGRLDEGARVLRGVLADAGVAYPETGRLAMAGTLLSLARIGARGLRLRERKAAAAPERERLPQLGACLTATRGLAAYDMIRGAYFAVETLRLALLEGDPSRAARSLAAVGSMVAYSGSAFGVRLGERMLEESLCLARHVGDPALKAAAEVSLGISRMTAGRWAEAVATVDPALRFLRERCVGYGHECIYGEMTSVLALEYLGRLREVEWRAAACRREAETTGNLYTRVQAYLYLSLGRLAADDPGAATALARDALALWPPEQENFLFQHWLGLKTSVYSDLYAGRAVDAFQRICSAWPRAERSSLLELQFVRVFALQLRAGASLALAAARPADRRRLVAMAERDARRLEREPAPIARAAASLIHATAAAQRGRTGGALGYIEEAIAGYEAAGMALHAAAARRRRGVLAGGDEGRRQVAEADAHMAAEGIAKPERWAAMYAPGFD
ncbi:serine/threonine-protein kinase [Sorangium sp. So ce388]|uniref:serine/threonine-protein kinase n=1 Tax=Sorangium sp. So ce388 TaxID=3133309 RepID=UPI003F5B7557